MMLIQVDNIIQFISHPLESTESPEVLRNKYGSQIEGERVVVYDNNNIKYAWIFKCGKYVNE